MASMSSQGGWTGNAGNTASSTGTGQNSNPRSGNTDQGGGAGGGITIPKGGNQSGTSLKGIQQLLAGLTTGVANGLGATTPQGVAVTGTGATTATLLGVPVYVWLIGAVAAYYFTRSK